MPIVGWLCPATRRREPFGHFDACADGPHGRTAFPAWMASEMEHKVLHDVRHSTLDITATQVMDCPRRIYLSRTVDYYANPQGLEAATRGTILHARAAQRANPDVFYTESNDPVRMDLHGTLFGVNISALVDQMRRDLTEITDYKFPKDGSIQYRPDGHVAPSKQSTFWKNVEYAAQLNMGRLLLAQQPWAIEAGYDPGNVMLTLVDGAIGKDGGAKHYAVKHMDEGEIADVRPWNSALTIQQHVDILKAAREAYEAASDEEKERVIASIPLVGVPMLKNKTGQGTKCASCEVRAECDALVRRYGRPEMTV